MSAWLRAVWRTRKPYERAFLVLGAAQLAVAGVFALLWLAQGGTLEGPVSHRKVILFGQSFALVSVAYAFTFRYLGLPRVLEAPFGWFSVALSAMEVGFAAMQFCRGQASHFNYTTDFNAAIAITMSSGAIIYSLFVLAVLPLTLRLRPERVPAEERPVLHGVKWSMALLVIGLAP